VGERERARARERKGEEGRESEYLGERKKSESEVESETRQMHCGGRCMPRCCNRRLQGSDGELRVAVASRGTACSLVSPLIFPTDPWEGEDRGAHLSILDNGREFVPVRGDIISLGEGRRGRREGSQEESSRGQPGEEGAPVEGHGDPRDSPAAQGRDAAMGGGGGGGGGGEAMRLRREAGAS
jgi:hypothetical protein